MKALLIFGARPNYMKIAPLYRAMVREPGFSPVLVNTGQHFDKAMSDVFIRGLGLPEPDIHLHVGVGSQAQQIARVIQKLEAVLTTFQPDVTVVVGDVNSTLAGAIASSTVGVPIAHVEAGLRSRDWTMPEERNRVLTDRLSRFLFTPSDDGDENLKAEGIEPSRIHMVGNVMIDTLDWVLPRLPKAQTRAQYGIPDGDFGLVTLHRASNVDNPQTLREIIEGLKAVSNRVPLFFPIHPRTQKRLAEFKIGLDGGRITLLPPLGYIEFIALLSQASLALTDSGGIQEETTVLGVPCLTIRESTERPITLKYGLNELIKAEKAAITAGADRTLSLGRMEPQRPPLWDGRAAERVVEVLARELAPRKAGGVAVWPRGLKPCAAVILAGGLRPSPLCRDLQIPAMCLPLSGNRTLLSEWLGALERAGECRQAKIIVSEALDAEQIQSHLSDLMRSGDRDIEVEVIVEPARWRGTGGIIRDVADSIDEGNIILLAEGACVPPGRLDLLVEALGASDLAAVGMGDGSQPAGVYAVRREAFDLVPEIGFFDVKEQLLPALYGRRHGARAVNLGGPVIRLRSRAGYLKAVASRFDDAAQSTAQLRELFAGTIHPSVRIAGPCLIERGVSIAERAIIHGSVLLQGARVGAGAIVSRSVIGANAEIAEGRVVTDAVESSRPAQVPAPVSVGVEPASTDRPRPGLEFSAR